MADNTLKVLLSGDSKELDAALSRADKKLKEFGDSAKDIGRNLSLSLTAPLALAGGAAVNLAKDFNESLNKVDVAFKGSAYEVEAFAKTTLKSFGIAEGTALDMAALFGDMATSMGLSTKEAAGLSTSLVGLAGDLASFKNMNIEEVTTALNGIFTGETESLKRLGVVMTETNLKAFALANGFKKKYEEMSQGEKVMLRYQYVMKSTANAHGDFERTGGGVANQMRMLSESLKEVGTQFGQVMLPFVNKVVKALNGLVASIGNTSEATKGFIVVLGAIAAAAGPVLFAIGAISGNIVSGFTTAKKAVTALYSVIMANPWIALATAVGIAGLALANAMGVFNGYKTTQQEINSLQDESIKNTQKEKNAMERLFEIAKNQNIKIEERKKAIASINAISPEYLGNINLENINTQGATKALNSYNRSLEKKSLLQAGMTRITEIDKEILDLQTGAAEAGTSATGALSKAWASLTKSSPYLMAAEAEKYAAGQSKKHTDERVKTLKESQAKIAKLVGVDLNKVDQTETETKKTADPVDPEKADKAAQAFIKQGQAMSEARLHQLAMAKATQENLKWETEYQKKLEQNKYYLIDQAIQKSISHQTEFLQSTQAANKSLEALGAHFQKFPAYGEMVNAIKSPISAMNESIKASAKVVADDLAAKQVQFDLIMTKGQEMANAVSGAFGVLGQSIMSSMGEATTGLERFLQGMAQTAMQLAQYVIKEIIMQKALAMATATTNATKSASATGPAAIFTQPAFIAMAVGGVLSSFASIPKFAAGGIVSGPTMGIMGEYAGARSNPEVIAPLNKLQGMLDNGGGGGAYTLETKVSGQDLLLVLQRAEKQNKRLG